MSDNIKKINKKTVAAVTKQFADKEVLFERMTAPIPEYKDGKVVDFLALELVYNNEDSHETIRVVVDATQDVKARLMTEKVLPWSPYDGYSLKVKAKFDSDGTMYDYQIIYDKPKTLTAYGFEMVDDFEYNTTQSKSHESINKPHEALSTLITFRRLKLSEAQMKKLGVYVSVDRFDSFLGNNTVKVVESVKDALNNYLNDSKSSKKPLVSTLLQASDGHTYMIVSDDGEAIVVNGFAVV